VTGPPDARPGCTTPIAPAAGAGHDLPAGARAEPSAAPAGDQGGDGRARWKAAAAAHNAALRRRTGRKAGSSPYRAGMARRPPPPPDGDQAA
jgi:hypothetical protein